MPSLDQNLAIQEEKLRTAGCQMIRIRYNVSEWVDQNSQSEQPDLIFSVN